MQKMNKSGSYLLLIMCVALLLATLPLFAGGAVSVADNTDWTDTTFSDVSNILDIEALDANTAWAVGTLWGGGGVILKTTDGGVTWEKQKTLTGSWPAQALSSVSVVDANTAWASGYRVLLKTTDGGANWDVVYGSASMYEGVPDVYAVDADNAWAILIDATLTSYIFKTSDGGATWVKLYTRPQTSGALVRISAVDNATAWAVGGGSSGVIVKTSDMGATWQDQSPAGAPMLYNILALDANNALASGGQQDNGIVMRTSDGGASWTPVCTSSTIDSFQGLAAKDPSTIWVAGQSGSPAAGLVMKSVDAGATWQTLYSTSSSYLYCVSTADAANAWAGGGALSRSTILHTVNGGNALPDITSIMPTTGQAGDTLTIIGCDFGAERGTSTVTFGGIEAASCTSWLNMFIEAVVPAGLSGNCEVAVTTAAGKSNHMDFLAAYPVSLDSVEPASGLQFAISQEVKLVGSGFSSGAAVRFRNGGIVLDAYNVNVVSASEITCTIGLFGVEPGAYDVVVTNPDGGGSTLTGGFAVNTVCGAGGGTAAAVLGCTLGLLSLGHNLNRRRRRY